MFEPSRQQQGSDRPRGVGRTMQSGFEHTPNTENYTWCKTTHGRAKSVLSGKL